MKRSGQWWQPLSKLSKRCLKDDVDVLGMAHVCRSFFVHVNLEADQGSGVTEHKRTVQSKLRSVEVWFMTGRVRAGWRDLSTAEACKSGLFKLVNNCEIQREEYIHSGYLFCQSSFLPSQNGWLLNTKRLRQDSDTSDRKLSEKEAKLVKTARPRLELYCLLWDSLSVRTKELEVDIRLLNVFKPWLTTIETWHTTCGPSQYLISGSRQLWMLQ